MLSYTWVNCFKLSRTSESLLGVAAGLMRCANNMPSRPNVARTKTIRKRERRELPAMCRNPRAGTWRDPATPSERSITCESARLVGCANPLGVTAGRHLLGLTGEFGASEGQR